MMNHSFSSCNSQDHVMGTCTCGYYYYGKTNMYSYTPSSVSSSSLGHVDCTLSLGTPSTRFSEDADKRGKRHHHDGRGSSQNPHSHAKPSMGSNSDSFFYRRCCNCDTTSTPLWRNGPRGPKTLCNACGIRYKKEERRASAAAVAATTTVPSGGQMESVAAEHNMYSQNNNNSWYYTNSQGNGELRFMDYDANDDMDPFTSWRLNVADRTSLVHDFTR